MTSPSRKARLRRRARHKKILLRLVSAHGPVCYICHRFCMFYKLLDTTYIVAPYKQNTGKLISINNIYLCRQATVDPIIPISKGGTGAYKNLAIACYQCNSSKGNRI